MTVNSGLTKRFQLKSDGLSTAHHTHSITNESVEALKITFSPGSKIYKKKAEDSS